MTGSRELLETLSLPRHETTYATLLTGIVLASARQSLDPGDADSPASPQPWPYGHSTRSVHDPDQRSSRRDGADGVPGASVAAARRAHRAHRPAGPVGAVRRWPRSRRSAWTCSKAPAHPGPSVCHPGRARRSQSCLAGALLGRPPRPEAPITAPRRPGPGRLAGDGTGRPSQDRLLSRSAPRTGQNRTRLLPETDTSPPAGGDKDRRQAAELR
jgi:hypothetical protein